MTKTFTQDDVIRYIYNETSIEESLEIEQAMLCDAELQSWYKQFSITKSQIDAANKIPSDNALRNILNYSKSLNLRPIK